MAGVRVRPSLDFKFGFVVVVLLPTGMVATGIFVVHVVAIPTK